MGKDYSYIRTESTPFKRIFGEKTLMLYFIAWLMFSLVDSFEGLVLDQSIDAELDSMMTTIEPLIAGVAAAVGGLISDWGGRKRIVIFGFISLGIAYGIIGIVQTWISWIFYFLVDGIALGLLWVVFVVVIWGDLTESSQEKYYAIGLTPFFLSQMARSLFFSYAELIPPTSTFSLAAFFLFIAVIPLLYAKETLPEKKIFEHQVRSYTREALKLKERVAEQ
jgi:MFS family permease